MVPKSVKNVFLFRPLEHTGQTNSSITSDNPKSQHTAKRHACGTSRVPACSLGGVCKKAAACGIETPLRQLRSRREDKKDLFKSSSTFYCDNTLKDFCPLASGTTLSLGSISSDFICQSCLPRPSGSAWTSTPLVKANLAVNNREPKKAGSACLETVGPVPPIRWAMLPVTMSLQIVALPNPLEIGFHSLVKSRPVNAIIGEVRSK